MNEQLRALVQRLLNERERVLLAIDGCSGAGKTTCAAALAAAFDAAVFHMDDFFLSPHRKTAERLAQPGGNVDYERVAAEVLSPLKRGETVYLRRYDCHSGRLLPPKAVKPARLAVVEGVYSCHPVLRDAYDAAVFLTVPPEIQRRRIIAREGAEKWTRFEREWIPLENRYFEAFHVAEGCDLVVEAE